MRTSLFRFKAVVGMPSTLAVTCILFGQYVVSLIDDAVEGPKGRAAVLAVLALVVVALFRRWDRQLHAGHAAVMGLPATAKVNRRRGLVILVGFESDLPTSAAAKLLKASSSVEYVALLGTPQTAEKGVTARIRRRLMPAALGRPLPEANVRSWESGNAQSLADFEQATREAIRWMLEQGLTAEEIVVDVTCGRRPMTWGALTAADGAAVEAQYLAERWDHRSNSPIRGTETFKTIVTLYPDSSTSEPVIHLPAPEQLAELTGTTRAA